MTNRLTYPAGWAEPAPCGCVSGCSGPPLASASPCSGPLPACEQRGAASAHRTGNCCTQQSSTEPSPAAASCLCWTGCPQRQGKVSPKAGAGWEPATYCNSKMSLGKADSSKSSQLAQAVVSPNGASVAQLSPDAHKAGNLFHITAAFRRK